MSPFDKVAVGMAAEKLVTVTPEMTVGHAVPGMPAVYGTPMMILHMEMAAGSAIQPSLPEGYVSVGMMVNIRHLAATPVGRTVRAVARVVGIETRSVVFEVEAWDGDRKIGDGTHRRGVVNVAEFERRFGVTKRRSPDSSAVTAMRNRSETPTEAPQEFRKATMGEVRNDPQRRPPATATMSREDER